MFLAIREIVKEGNDCLRKVCRPVEKFDERLAILLDDMAETMYEGNGVGLAAPQVGVLRRVVVIDCGDRLYELINPEIIAQAGALDEAEGCLVQPWRICFGAPSGESGRSGKRPPWQGVRTGGRSPAGPGDLP